MTPPPVPAADPAAAPSAPAADLVWTIPNALSALRLVGVPVFLFLVLGPHHDRIAFVLLMVSGVSDYLDGKLARRWDQVSRLGTLLDPLADRLYVVSTVLALVIRDVVPWPLLAVLLGRDVYLAVLLAVLRRHGWAPLAVSYLGKAATFNLLYAFPFLLLSLGGDTLATVARPVGWAFALWGTALYVVAGVLYTVQARRLLSGDVRDGVDRSQGAAVR